MAETPVSVDIVDNVALIVIDNPPVNASSHSVRSGLMDAVRQIAEDASVQAIALYGAGRTFIAGADIKEFGKPLQPPSLPDVINAIEALEKPVVVAIHGTALGGGLEVTLGCHYRVATPNARVGLPEVNLGLVPGAGGTQRAPRLVGVEAAIDIITSGRHVPAEEALDLGLIDEIVDGTDMRAIALDAGRRLISENRPVRRIRDMSDKVSGDLSETFAKARQRVGRKARGQESPLRCIDAIEAGTNTDLDTGLKREREIFFECMESDQRSGLIHAFFSERAVAKVPGLEGATPKEIASVGVIGGGTMGTGITCAHLLAGIPVTMVERDAESIEKGRSNVMGVIDGALKRGKIDAATHAEIVEKLYRPSTDYADLGSADLVIEAVFEEMDIKKAVFEKIDAIAKPGAILASNTSYLDINEIASVTGRPEDVLGLHFFSPAHVMKLLEIVIADKTSPDVSATAFALAKRIRKVGVRAGVCDGFIGNRMLNAYRKQADYLMEDGASPYEIDRVLEDFGFAMGAFKVADLAGLDIGWANRKRAALTRDPRERHVPVLERICERGWFGQKTGRGYYNYPNGPRDPQEDDEVLGIIDAVRREDNVNARPVSRDEILDRYMAAMVNEGAKILEEGIALRPLDIDVVKLMGYGFPRYRGGPMHYADTIGLHKIVADIERFRQDDDYFWQPSKLLLEMARDGRRFADLNG